MMAVGAPTNQLKAAAEKRVVMAAAATAIAAGTNNNQIKSGCGETAILVVVVALLLHNSDSCKDNNNSDNNGDDKCGGRSSGSGGSGDGDGDGCGGALGNLPLVNDATIVSMTFPTRPPTLMPLQWLHRDKRQQHVRRGRGWATTQCHLPSVAVAVVMDQSKLPKDNSG